MPQPVPHVPSPRPSDDDGAIEMGRIFLSGTLWGLPIWFVIATALCRMASVSWAGSALIGLWGALVGGPFFGALIFFGKRVGELSE